MSGEAYNWVSLGPSIRATGGVLLKSGGLVRKGENCTAGSPAPTMESPCPPGFRGVVGPLGSFHQQLRASALDPAVKASIPAPLPSNELGVNGLLRNGLPCRVKINAGAVRDETRFCESNRAESIHVRADIIVGESATIRIQPVIRADRAEMRVLDRAVLEAAAGRGVDVKKQTVPRLSVQAAEDDGRVGKSFQNTMPR